MMGMKIIAAVVMVASSFSSVGSSNSSVAMPEMVAAYPTSMSLTLKMRELWLDHIDFTREYVVSALAGLPDVVSLNGRLLENQDAIGRIMGSYYGSESGQRLAGLLREHILIATAVVAASKKGDRTGLAAAQVRWTANGDQLVAWFNGANPNWSKEDCSNMLRDHLKLTTDEISARVAADWPADIRTCDKLRAHMMHFADYLCEGLVKQFPKRFNDCL
jgi:hypothetical protein